jgi:hypothetical protein
MPAYTGYRHQNQARMQQALDMLRGKADISSNTPGQTDDEGNLIYTNVPKTEYIREIREVPFVNTNGISQWSLNYMETAKLLELMNEEGDQSDDNN